LQRAERPVLLVGSQALLEAPAAEEIAGAIERLGMPVYLSCMARGMVGKQNAVLLRHKRREALKEADLVILAGVPCDFRLDYGRHIRRGTYLISANRSRNDLKKNRRPHLAVLGDPGLFLRRLAAMLPANDRWKPWREHLRQRDNDREKEILQQAAESTVLLNPVHLCLEIEKALPPNSVIVADGGDFVATASYTVSPPGPLTWLDPGVFGTLGVGAGFALGAKLCRPDAEVWILFGDGAAGYSLSEFDTFARHQIPVLAIVGNDACWTQIAREQIEMLKDDVGTVLRFADYHLVAEGFGGKGFLLKAPQQISDVLQQARKSVAEGQPVLVNAHLGKTAFRKGSISM
jgi:acetolactate synthase-1/2/3 large subunit